MCLSPHPPVLDLPATLYVCICVCLQVFMYVPQVAASFATAAGGGGAVSGARWGWRRWLAGCGGGCAMVRAVLMI